MEPGSFVLSRTAIFLHVAGTAFQESVNRERTVEADFNKADLFAVCVHVVDRLFNRFTYAAHSYDNLSPHPARRSSLRGRNPCRSSRLLSSYILLQQPERCCNMCYMLPCSGRRCRGLRAAAQNRMLRIERRVTEFFTASISTSFLRSS